MKQNKHGCVRYLWLQGSGLLVPRGYSSTRHPTPTRPGLFYQAVLKRPPSPWRWIQRLAMNRDPALVSDGPGLGPRCRWGRLTNWRGDGERGKRRRKEREKEEVGRDGWKGGRECSKLPSSLALSSLNFDTHPISFMVPPSPGVSNLHSKVTSTRKPASSAKCLSLSYPLLVVGIFCLPHWPASPIRERWYVSPFCLLQCLAQALTRSGRQNYVLSKWMKLASQATSHTNLVVRADSPFQQRYFCHSNLY